MEKLEKLNKLAPIFRDCIYQYQNVDLQALECANKAKELMIDFAKHLLQGKVTKCTKGTLEETIKEEYWPHEYQLLFGDLIKNSDNIFNKFIEEYETLDN